MKYFVIAGVVVLVAVVGIVFYLQQPKAGVRPIAWDQEACAHCHMHIGDPHFAAQLQTNDGDVLDFDDPGCLFSYLDANKPMVKEIYFHHHAKDEWLTQAMVGFVHLEQDTPMGYGIGAVNRSETANAMSFEEARHAIQGRGHSGVANPMQSMHHHAGVAK